MTARFHQLAVLVLTAASLLLLLYPTQSKPPEKKAMPTAEDIAKEWRYPGVSVDYSLTNSDAFYIERYTVEKANFVKVWNHYAAKSGSKAQFKENMIWAEMLELQKPEKGQSMVFTLGGATHFGQNTPTKTVHVEIRPSSDKQIEITVVVGTR